MAVKDKVVEAVKAVFNAKGKRLNALGQELPSSLPMEPPVGYRPGPTLMEQIQAMVRSEKLAQDARDAGLETFEEADDFDIPDDPLDPLTQYEADYEGGRVRDLRKKYEDDVAKERLEKEAAEREVAEERSRHRSSAGGARSAPKSPRQGRSKSSEADQADDMLSGADE